MHNYEIAELTPYAFSKKCDERNFEPRFFSLSASSTFPTLSRAMEVKTSTK